MPTDTPLTGLALATALWDANLAAPGVDTYDGGLRYVLTGDPWEPWRAIGDVWHLVLHYRLRIELDYCDQGTWVWHEQHYEQAASDDDIPAAVGRLALRLRASDLAQEATP